MARIHQDVELEPEEGETVEGIEAAEEEVRKFLAMLRANEEVEGSVRLVLFQFGRTKEDEDAIWEEEFVHAESDDEQAAAIVEAAAEDIRGLRTKKVKYVLRADGVRARQTFTLKFEEGSEGDDYDDFDETPTRKGLLAQQMRHLEQMTGRFSKKDKLLWDMLTGQLSDARARIKDLEERGIANVRAYEDLLSAKHVRDMEIQRLSNQERRKDQVAGVLVAGIPSVIAKFVGGMGGLGGGGPQIAAAVTAAPCARTPIEQLLEGFLRTLTPDQFKTIQASGIFKPEQLMLLFQLVQAIMDRDAAEAASSGHDGQHGGEANGSPNPAETPRDRQPSADPSQA